MYASDWRLTIWFICTQHLYETFVRKNCTKHLYETFVRNICTKHLYETFVRNVCTKHLYETFVRNGHVTVGRQRQNPYMCDAHFWLAPNNLIPFVRNFDHVSIIWLRSEGYSQANQFALWFVCVCVCVCVWCVGGQGHQANLALEVPLFHACMGVCVCGAPDCAGHSCVPLQTLFHLFCPM